MNRRQPTSMSRRRFLGSFGVAAAGLAALPIIAACDDGGRHVVQMTTGYKFEPAALTIPKGDTVTWLNNDSQTHTVVDDPSKSVGELEGLLPQGAKVFDSGDVHPGNSWSHRFDTPGRYVYFCRIHADRQMLGTIFVTD